jgi:hypothetical protein
MSTSFLADRTPQKGKAPVPAPQVYHVRLLRMQRQTQLAHHKPDTCAIPRRLFTPGTCDKVLTLCGKPVVNSCHALTQTCNSADKD